MGVRQQHLHQVRQRLAYRTRRVERARLPCGAGISAEKAAEALELVEKANPVVLALGAIELGTRAGERDAVFGLFLDALGLNGIGPEDNPFEADIPGEPSATFEDDIAITSGRWVIRTSEPTVALGCRATNGTRTPSASGPKGWSIRVKIFEISSCDASNPDQGCIDGYGNQFGTADQISPQLRLELDLLHDGRSFAIRVGRLPLWDVRYDAVAFGETQPNIAGLLP